MTEQLACALCGAGGHLAAQCNWNQGAAAFQREDRYIVIKRSDVERFWRADVRDQFMAALKRLNQHHVRVPQRKYVVVESDWPEYETVWRMIEARVTGAALAQPHQAHAAADLLREWLENDDEAKDWVEFGGRVKIALAQPSPAPALERPEAVGYCDPSHIQRMKDDKISGFMVHDEKGTHISEPLMTVAQYDRIAGALIAECWAAAGGNGPATRDDLLAALRAMNESEDDLEAKLKAAQARVAELEKQEPVAEVIWFDGMKHKDVDWCGDAIEKLPLGTKLYAAPVAQAGQVPEASANDKVLGWTLDYRFLECVTELAASRTEYSTSMEATEHVLLAARELLAAAPAQGGSTDE